MVKPSPFVVSLSNHERTYDTVSWARNTYVATSRPVCTCSCTVLIRGANQFRQAVDW